MNSKVALVTGASSGIGEATTLKLLGQGYTVYAAARRVERMRSQAEMEEIMESIENQGLEEKKI